MCYYCKYVMECGKLMYIYEYPQINFTSTVVTISVCTTHSQTSILRHLYITNYYCNNHCNKEVTEMIELLFCILN